MKDNKKKDIIIIFLMLLLTIFYFTYAVTITWDSAHYMIYVNIFERILPVSSWDIVRGPVFPLIIHISNIIFGKTAMGLLINSYIYYLVMLYFVYKISKLSKLNKKTIIVLIVSIILNPIIYGYYHALLTEFVAMTISLVSCYISIQLLTNNNPEEKKKNIVYSIAIIIITVFGWFLKQPYVSIGLFPLITATTIKLFSKEKFKNKIPMISTLFLCLITLFISIKTWNCILEKYGLNSKSDRNPTSVLGNQLIEGTGNLKINNNINDIDKIINTEYLTEKDKNKILELSENKDYSFKIIDVYKSNKLVDRQFYDINTRNISTFESLKILISNLFKHPIIMLDSYISNYLSIIDIYETVTNDSQNYKINKKVNIGFAYEISAIGFKPYSYTSNIFYIHEDTYERVINYEQFNQAPKVLNYIMIILGKIAILIFKFIYLLLPFTLLISIALRIKTKEKKYNIPIVLLGYSLLHALLHVITGAIIDRYLMPCLITVMIGTIDMITYIINNKRSKVNEEGKSIIRNTRV